MLNSSEIYSNRVLQQKLNREKQKRNYESMILGDSDSDSDLTIDDQNDPDHEVADNETSMEIAHHLPHRFHENIYVPDDLDNLYIENENLIEHDNSPPLYDNASITVNEAVNLLMKFFIDANFDKTKVVSMMRLIKRILPSTNKLPTSFQQILRIYGKTPCSTEKYYCNSCFSSTTKESGQHYCNNIKCSLHNCQLSKREVTEVVIVNIREKLQSIIKRNFSLLSKAEELYPSFDIPSGIRYKNKTKNTSFPVTLLIHADGAPLVRSTKSAVWPCFGAIVELPPPVREYQSNILTLGLWVSAIKPNVNFFLEDIIEQLLDLSKHGTTIFIDENEIKLNVNMQYFISDLPAKSLFMKTINFNGYYACTNCITEGNFRGFNISVIYLFFTNLFH